MFSKRSEENELMDNLITDSDEFCRNLEELDIYNDYLGGKSALIKALNKLIKNNSYFKNNKIKIADLGCGSGYLLMAIAQWAKLHKINVELLGVDVNPIAINYAIKNSVQSPNIKYLALDIFSTEFKKMQFDIVFLNSVTHHFNDASLIQLFKQLTKQTHSIIINDLQRHWLIYFLIKWAAKILNFSYLTQHDGPLSVLRSFRKQELINLFKQAKINSYQIHWAWICRWLVIIECRDH